jgi:hypothetical protein
MFSMVGLTAPPELPVSIIASAPPERVKVLVPASPVTTKAPDPTILILPAVGPTAPPTLPVKVLTSDGGGIMPPPKEVI